RRNGARVCRRDALRRDQGRLRPHRGDSSDLGGRVRHAALIGSARSVARLGLGYRHVCAMETLTIMNVKAGSGYLRSRAAMGLVFASLLWCFACQESPPARVKLEIVEMVLSSDPVQVLVWKWDDQNTRTQHQGDTAFSVEPADLASVLPNG